MATFPILSTGSITQYPLSKGTGFSVDVTRFLDGSDQRCLARGKRLRRWAIQLSKLTEPELADLEQFFEQSQGNFGHFEFVDPLTGETVPNCRLANPTIVTEYLAAGNGSASLSVVENYG